MRISRTMQRRTGKYPSLRSDLASTVHRLSLVHPPPSHQHGRVQLIHTYGHHPHRLRHPHHHHRHHWYRHHNLHRHLVRHCCPLFPIGRCHHRCPLLLLTLLPNARRGWRLCPTRSLRRRRVSSVRGALTSLCGVRRCAHPPRLSHPRSLRKLRRHPRHRRIVMRCHLRT